MRESAPVQVYSRELGGYRPNSRFIWPAIWPVACSVIFPTNLCELFALRLYALDFESPSTLTLLPSPSAHVPPPIACWALHSEHYIPNTRRRIFCAVYCLFSTVDFAPDSFLAGLY
jgi:hypothetical protein